MIKESPKKGNRNFQEMKKLPEGQKGKRETHGLSCHGKIKPGGV
jgi:hypothetical protein